MERLGKVEGSYHLVDLFFFQISRTSWLVNQPPVKYPPKKSRFNSRPYGGKLTNHRALFLWECSSLGGWLTIVMTMTPVGRANLEMYSLPW